MTYPPSNPGYPPQSGSQFDATQQFAKAVPASVPAAPAASAGAESGDNKMSEILLAVVAVAGLLIYLLRFAPLLDLSGLAGGGQVVSSGDRRAGRSTPRCWPRSWPASRCCPSRRTGPPSPR
ncbi:transmembrane protein [Mycolicibacterium conceptionense]|uniref:Transmembrane protein n=1 Tax=Mycolicibacterium conceptionense TaxID=451644 RepID=A0A0U1DHZ5_9MYCO|nr:transmembrane protein [Mycolicibacterium conceptionense]